MGEEQLEVVDLDGNVLEVVPRSRIRAENLLHRTTFVIVRSSQGDVLVHRRADWKDLLPGWWDLAFGGAAAIGESWEDAARRELAEEAGIDTPLRPLGSYHYDGDDSKEVGRLFTTISDGPFSHPDGEVAESRFVPLDGLVEFVTGHAVCGAAVEVVLPVLEAEIEGAAG
jgi:8-oxo-dGTP pyrophosphatase MutT (NUDIX family)